MGLRPSVEASESGEVEELTAGLARLQLSTDPPASPLRYYVIFACRRQPDLVGVHHCQWGVLLQKLPGQALFGSGARDCKAFSDLSSAEAYFRERAGSGVRCRVFEYVHP
jgi:hypothetical protein